MSPAHSQDHLDRLRSWRNPKPRDLTLRFMPEQFKRQVARPHKQLAMLVELWSELVPDALLSHTRLAGLARGVLHVEVDSSARLYELDRLLRSGLQQQIITRHRGPAMRKIQLRVASWQERP